MRRTGRAAARLLAAACLAGLAACSGTTDLLQGKKVDYKSAGQLPTLEIPPDLLSGPRLVVATDDADDDQRPADERGAAKSDDDAKHAASDATRRAADGDYADSLCALARREGIADSVYWTGLVLGDEKWGAFQAAEIFVLPAAFGLWSFALVFSALDAAALAVRIRAESAALRS